MKILFLIDNLIKGGKERRMLELIKGLLQTTPIEIELVLFRKVIEYTEIRDLDVKVHILERKPRLNPLVFLRLYKICEKMRPDVIHSWSSMSSIFAFPCSKLQGVPLLNSSIANAPKNPKIWQKKVFWAKLTFLFSDRVVGNSEAGLNSYKVPKHKRLCIYNGYDFSRSKNITPQEEIRKKYKIKDEFVIGKVAAFANRKDYETYVQAAQNVLNKHHNVKFFAIGNGHNIDRIRSMVPEKLKNKIIFTEALRNVESVIQIFDVGVLATNSRIHGEGISNAIMEYMAFGKPVVATEGGGTNEIVQHNKTGFLVPFKSPEQMAERILYFIENPKEAQQMGEAAKERIQHYFNIDKMIATYFNLYSQLIIEKNSTVN